MNFKKPFNHYAVIKNESEIMSNYLYIKFICRIYKLLTCYILNKCTFYLYSRVV